MDGKVLDYKLTEAQAEKVDGVREQKAIVNQEEKKNITNTITVDEVKELDKKNDSKQDTDISELKKEVNEKVSFFEVQNVKSIPEVILSKLKAGDVVQKQDSTGKHSYIVSFKKDNVGICLTYTDASVVETQSYDYTDGHWVYNSEDKMPLVDVEGASSGTIVDALGLNAQGKLVKGSAGGGGTQLYKHELTFGEDTYRFNVVSLDSQSYVSNASSTILGVDGVGHDQYSAQVGIKARVMNYGTIVATIYYINASNEITKIEGRVLTDAVTPL